MMLDSMIFSFPETNIALKIGGWKIKFPFGMACFQGLC